MYWRDENNIRILIVNMSKDDINDAIYDLQHTPIFKTVPKYTKLQISMFTKQLDRINNKDLVNVN